MVCSLLSFGDLKKMGFSFKEKNSEKQVAKTPKEGKWFRVEPKTIKRRLFVNPRENVFEERARKLIVEALKEMDANPKRYKRIFKTTFPVRKWEFCKAKHLKTMAKLKGGHLGNWVEQALEWAQRISNGESWETLCIAPDTSRNFRIIEWEKRVVRLIGGSQDAEEFSAPTDYEGGECDETEKIKYATPFIVMYCK